jgi:ligand-binding sensor domain-containing protein
MKLTLFYCTIFSILIACKGQSNRRTINSAKLEEHSTIGDTVKALSNNIMVIYQDKKNNYWFGSWKDGLYKYDGKTIIHFSTKDGLPDNRVEEIQEDKFGNLYFNTSNGLCKFDGTHFQKLTEAIGFDNNWRLNAEDLWFKSSGPQGFVYRFDGNNLYRLKLPTIKLGEDYLLKHPNIGSPYSIYCIYKDSKANIWFGMAQLGACRYNGKSFDWITEPDLTELHDGPANGVRSITEDKNGDFWFNTEYRYTIDDNPENKGDDQKIYKRIKSIGCLDGKKEGPLNEYLSIIKDNNNNLWIATYLGGVWCYDGETIKHYPIELNAKTIPIFCLFKDNNGAIWLGTHENGAFKFNGKSFERVGL